MSTREQFESTVAEEEDDGQQCGGASYEQFTNSNDTNNDTTGEEDGDEGDGVGCHAAEQFVNYEDATIGEEDESSCPQYDYSSAEQFVNYGDATVGEEEDVVSEEYEEELHYSSYDVPNLTYAEPLPDFLPPSNPRRSRAQPFHSVHQSMCMGAGSGSCLF